METVTTKAQLVWPATVAACHAVLQNIYSKYQTLLAGFIVKNAAVQQLTTAQNQQQREAAEVDKFMSVHRTKTVEDIAEKPMKLKGLPSEFAELKAALPTMHARLEKQIHGDYDRQMEQSSQAKQRKWQHRKQLKLH